MAELYTPTEATALYNKCKISYDPKAYSLRDSLKLTTKVTDLMKHHIQNITFGAEQALVATIQSFHKKDYMAYIQNIFESSIKGTFVPKCMGVYSADSAFCKKDDMYIAVHFLRTFGYSDMDLKTKRILEAIVQTCVALSSPKSCSADLHWLVTEFRKDKYEDLHNFTRLKTALATKADVLPVYLDRGTSLTQFVPVPEMIGVFNPRIQKTGLPSDGAKCVDEGVAYTNMLYAMFGFMETLWAIKSLPEDRLQRIATLFAGNPAGAPVVGSIFSTMFVDASFNPLPEIDRIISIANPKERFDEYRKYAEAHDFLTLAKDFGTQFLLGSPEVLFPAGMGAFVGFIETYSNTWVRINTCKILYEYAMANGLLKSDPEIESRITEDIADIECSSDMSKITSGTTTKTTSDLMDLSTHSECSAGMSGDVGSYISPTYEALDKAKAKYVDGRYEFSTEDKVDFSDEAKSRYETIAKKVTLVNKTLTQKLREIKTYNTGGKQAGLPSGRIDRKAIYRYKYDSNIFYNNTYKQLESDLAFGVILDISGSMHGKGIENGRITMIVLHETLKALGINHSIIGHTSNGDYKCIIERYQAFREDKTYNTRKNYALANLEAQSGNCDSASLFYMEKALMRAKNRDKICLIFSDGQPTECSGTDLREQVAHMERNHIKVIGIGINFPEIAGYYKDYANGKNLTDMLNIVANILKEYILKKKERA